MSAADNGVGTGGEPAGKPRRGRLWIVLLPLVVFLGLATVFMVQLLSGGDPSKIPVGADRQAGAGNDIGPPLPA